MQVTQNHLKGINSQKLAAIKRRYLKGYGIPQISKEVKIPKYKLTKIIIQMGIYDFGRQKRTRYYINKEDLINYPFSFNEMHYGKSGQSKYNWEELSPEERRLIHHENHKKLCTFAR